MKNVYHGQVVAQPGKKAIEAVTSQKNQKSRGAFKFKIDLAPKSEDHKD